ncbi:Pancreatic secretory granule membrane major glyco GP2 [Paramuricea clavata]|uniref:Pancreatic secretory granule membrane major glyco GP2 n=1 Tax=Paramuricea clavata TaxID=317549 RepID=A0A7D9HR65_PARCT|nr:Pancreatic secretory granule membrane major glyco GP2 [Paramuricea clavata]
MKKPAILSSAIAYGWAKRAVDLGLGTKAFTKTENNPWLKIDLMDVYFVHDVVVFNVLEPKHDGPMLDLNIRIGSASIINDNPLCTIANIYVGEGRSFYCDMFGQTVVIHRPGVVASMVIAELFVNTNNAENVPRKAAVSNTQHQNSRAPSRTIDSDVNQYWFVTEDGIVQEKTLTVELAGEFNIVMIYIITRALMQFELKLGLSEDFALQKHCIPGLHDLPVSAGYHFFCVERTLTKYIHIHQYDKERQMQISEILAFEKTKPVIDYNRNYKHVWAEEHKDVTLSCDINGYPAPVFSWIKDKTVVATGSRSLTLLHVKQNESCTYECWGNNTLGKWRICADHAEMKFDLKTTTVVENFEIRGNQWYSSYDDKQMKYLQFREKAPKPTASCQLWLKKKHPKLQDGIVSGTLCLRNTTHDCAATFDVDIRRCTAYYIYHFARLRSTTTYKFCFEPAAISTNGQHPAISSAVPNYALSDKIFQTETEVVESYQCLVMCQLDTQCKSFNFSQKEKICEMNTATKKEFPRSYGPRNNYSYYHLSSGIVKVARRRSEL